MIRIYNWRYESPDEVLEAYKELDASLDDGMDTDDLSYVIVIDAIDAKFAEEDFMVSSGLAAIEKAWTASLGKVFKFKRYMLKSGKVILAVHH